MNFRRKEICISAICMALFYTFYFQIFKFVLNIFNLTGDYTDYLTMNVESVGHLNLQSIYMFITIALAFLIATVTLVFERRIQYRGDDITVDKGLLTTNENFLLYTGFFATLCRLMVFRMNIINRFSYYFFAVYYDIVPGCTI